MSTETTTLACTSPQEFRTWVRVAQKMRWRLVSVHVYASGHILGDLIRNSK